MSKIGIFDSGMGGLTVAWAIIKALPNEDIVYYGDNFNAPFGDKSIDELREISKNIALFLLKHNVDIIVAACGTISANCIDVVKDISNLPVFDMIEPAIRVGASCARPHIIIMATASTISSHIHKKQIHEKNPLANVIEIACPKLVPLIESGDTKGIREAIKEYLSPIKGKKVDSLILGCTHYPLIKEQIIEYLETDVKIIDPAENLAKSLADYLPNNKLTPPKYSFYTSKHSEQFDNMVKLLKIKGK